MVDAFGDHQVGCGGIGDRIHRHNSIRDALFSAAQSAALAPRKEVPSLNAGSSSCPADVYLPNWKRDQPAALEVTVISSLQQQTLSGAAISPGHVLRVGQMRKMNAHAESCRAVMWASFLFPSWWSPWEGGVTKPPAPSPSSVAFWGSVWVFHPLNRHATCSSIWPPPFGEETLHCGFAASPPSLLRRMA